MHTAQDEYASDLVKKFKKYANENGEKYKEKYGHKSANIAILHFLVEEIAELKCELDDVKYRYKLRDDLDD